eukprot:PhF_6_TR30385/c0_g1_i1/m.44538/K10752/RBBP4, HAT2, CAF1, MIS16; histone-binding protein RBBP4
MIDPAEREIWQTYAPNLYSVFLSHILEWPTATLEWLPTTEAFPTARNILPDSDIAIHKFIMGTCAHAGQPNYIYVAEVGLPSRYNLSMFDEEAQLATSFPQCGGIANVVQIASVDGEVNVVRTNPENPMVVAVQCNSGSTLIYALHRRKAIADTWTPTPDMKLKGHRKEGVALSWSPVEEWTLASGAEDHLVCYYDLEANADEIGCSGSEIINPVRTYSGHKDAVQSVSWHHTHHYVLASGGDDKCMILWDTRVNKEVENVEVHRAEVNTVAFHPTATFQIATCSNDKTARLWDVRSFRKPVHEFVFHTEQVISLKWSSFSETVFATCGLDRQVCIWDVSRIDRSSNEKMASAGTKYEPSVPREGDKMNDVDERAAVGGDRTAPAELVFVHNGHIGPVCDIAWSPHDNEEWVVASVDHVNTFQVWCMNHKIHDDEIGLEVMEG